ncbi:NAD kinase [Ahrensia sp. R2A130]|uniref:NAD kinase n=1 Tax=Ahrensia sp. R2A130 TaxID=744979 RepID=UPI0001E0F086|nr:NAD kinase [Ahrensia sp. R2A130]EFL90448.1 probable inorganic polyphosphate/ATP-NAD kinase [Ahrensia sp. R2A130]
MANQSLAFLANSNETAQQALAELTDHYGQTSPAEADVIVALGGDGFMLQTQLQWMEAGKPIYGMNKGTVGFLMNEYAVDDLPARIAKAHRARIHPLQMVVTDADGVEHRSMAFNEVSLFRQSAQAAKLRIEIDGRERMEALVCDGLMVATPQGSTAYNLSAHGPILPLKAPLLALTPVSAFRPRNWRGALLPNHSKVRITVLETEKRPVNAVADNTEIKSAIEVHVHEDREMTGVLMFDPDHSWEERILDEQFRY